MNDKIKLVLCLVTLLFFSGCYITEVYAQSLVSRVSFAWDKPTETAVGGCDSVTPGTPIPIDVALGYKLRWSETGSEEWGEVDLNFITSDLSVHSSEQAFPCFMDIDVQVGAFWSNDTSKTVSCWSNTVTFVAVPSDPPGRIINLTRQQ